MSLVISLIFFDINNKYDKLEINEENFLSYFDTKDFSSPLNILKTFLSNSNRIEILKVKKTSTKIKVNFSYNLENQLIIFNIIILYDFSRIYNICLSSDGYFIFLNSQNKNIKEKLNDIIEYIKGSCDTETRIYFINVYEDQMLNEEENNSMKHYLNLKNLKCSYYQMLFEDNIYYDDDNSLPDEILNNIENDNITFEKLLKITFYYKTHLFPSYKLKSKSNSENKATSKCLIY